ncbi:hypothetical protein KC717_02815 [Candidatus Dojkabacteria bacterium]|uniref:Uncharacterized protein n=1 Tax=Candidatus Dojkabacteria bacterium TaxID=2099670 RepID=A0A955RKA1_9BACT|nr:hypothetical protein [Candidatus Dojkabacteria bacterium]
MSEHLSKQEILTELLGKRVIVSTLRGDLLMFYHEDSENRFHMTFHWDAHDNQWNHAKISPMSIEDITEYCKYFHPHCSISIDS